MRHTFAPIPNFPDYEISNTGWVLSLPRTVKRERQGDFFFPGEIMSPWMMAAKTPVVTIHDARGRRTSRSVALLLRHVWNTPIREAQRIALNTFEGRTERPKPVTIYRGEPIPSDELHRRIETS